MASSKTFKPPLTETKSVGTYKKPKRDLRALEITAFNKVHGAKASKIKKVTQPKAAATLDTVKDEFRKKLTTDITAYQKGRISHTVMMTRSTDAFRVMYQRAYQLGMQAQGVGKLASPRARFVVNANLTKADIQWIDSALRHELGYWQRFMRDIKTNSLRMSLQQRLEMYINTVDSVYTSGRVQGSPDTAIVSWIHGDAEHCTECILLERFSPFTKDSLPTTPRAGDTRCLSNCKCKLAIQRAPLHIYTAIKKRQHSKAYFLSVLKLSRQKR